MKDPIRPKKHLSKKPNFKNEKLDTTIKFISPCSYRDIRIPPRITCTVDVGGGNDTSVYMTLEEWRRLIHETTTQTINLPRERLGELDHPISVSSRSQLLGGDSSIGFLPYDLVPNPSTPTAVLGGESMPHRATTTMVFSPKKNLINRIKNYIVKLYKRFF